MTDAPASPPPPAPRPAPVRAARRRAPAAAGAAYVALGRWGLVHGRVSLELAGLVPGGDDARAARYAATLAAVGPGLVRRGAAA